MECPPPFLLNAETLAALIKLLLEKEALRRTVKARKFGLRVTYEDTAYRLFARVIRCTEEVLHLSTSHRPVPKLILTRQLSRLPRQTLKSYLFFAPLVLLLLFLGLSQSLTSAVLLPFLLANCLLLLVPLLLHRRTRIHLEHQCGYGKDESGQVVIVMGQLPSIQFQSYLAHEYAHQLCAQHREKTEAWMKEGWARLVQWRVSEHLYHMGGDPAYLFHALAQIIGELKFACEIIAPVLHTRLPRNVRRIRTIYPRNPLFALITGTPGSKLESLVDHAMGTASYFLAAEQQGVETALHEDLLQVFSK